MDRMVAKYIIIEGKKYRVWCKSGSIQSIQVLFVRNGNEMARNIMPEGDLWHSISQIIERDNHVEA